MNLFIYILLFVIVIQVVAITVDVESLLTTMTLEEKVGQMTQLDIQMFIDKTTGEVQYDTMREIMNSTKVYRLNNIYIYIL